MEATDDRVGAYYFPLAQDARRRNLTLVYPNNARRDYPYADDKLLAKEAADRPQSAREVVEASEPRHRKEATGLVSAYLSWHLERGLRSLAYVER